MNYIPRVAPVRRILLTAKSGRTLEVRNGCFPEMPRRIKADVLVCPYDDSRGEEGIDAFVKANPMQKKDVGACLYGVCEGTPGEGGVMSFKSSNPQSPHISIGITDRTYKMRSDDHWKDDAQHEREILDSVISCSLRFADKCAGQTVVFPLLKPRGLGIVKVGGGRGLYDKAGVAGAEIMVPAILGYLEKTAASVRHVIVLVGYFEAEIVQAVEKFRN